MSDYSTTEESETEEKVVELSEKDWITLIKEGKRSYIYKCNKQQLKQLSEELGIECLENTKVEDLRRNLSEYYKAISTKDSGVQCSGCMAERKNMTSTNFDIKSFDGEDWEVFEQQLDCIITLNELPDDKKVPLLITKLTPKVFETLTYLCSPQKPIKLSYTELCDKLTKQYKHKKPTALNRAEFRQRNQAPTEKIQDYVVVLKKRLHIVDSRMWTTKLRKSSSTGCLRK